MPLIHLRPLAIWLLRLLLCAGLAICAPWTALAQTNAQALMVQAETRQINPLSVAEVYKDATGQLGFDQILTPAIQKRFTLQKADHGGEINFGFTDATYWIKLTLQRSPLASDDWMLEIPYLSLNDLSFYAPGRQPIQVGTDFSSDQKPIFYPLYVMPIHLTTVPQTFYLRVRSQYALTLPLTLWSRAAFSREFSDKLLTQALYFGGLLALALYNFLLFLSLKDRSYLYYTLFALSMGLGMFAGNGYGRLYFWPMAAHWDMVAQTTFFSMAGALSLWFTTSFLRTRITSPKLNLWLNALAITYVMAAALLAASVWGHFSPTSIFELVLLITLPATLSTFLAGLRAYRSGNRSALYFLMACGSVWIGASVAALRAFDLLPSNSLTLYALQLGSCAEMLLLSFALAHRIHTEREQRIFAQEAALEARSKLLAVAQENEAILERKVTERSQKLQQIALDERNTREQYVRFGAMIAHEFRNPLGIIETQSTLLQRENQLGINKVDGRAETILGATHRLATLFDQWLKSDQLQQPISMINAAPVALQALLAQVIRAARGYHSDRQIELKPVPEVTLKSDLGLLEIALLNLIDNACKYSPANEPIGIDFTLRENQIGIIVWDNGAKIPAEQHVDIFKPYVRAKNIQTKPGVGLGLAFVAHIAELHHGSIEISNRLPNGNRFCLWLPCTL